MDWTIVLYYVSQVLWSGNSSIHIPGKLFLQNFIIDTLKKKNGWFSYPTVLKCLLHNA